MTRLAAVGRAVGSGLGKAGARAGRLAAELTERHVRLGVTGLSGAGKTVFITALVASLLSPGRLSRLRAEAEGRIVGAVLTEQPDPAMPRFQFERHRAMLTAERPDWPHSTRSISQLRVSVRFRPTAFLSRLGGAELLHVDIVDYPGEWLADLPLLALDYEAWAAEALRLADAAGRRREAAAWHAALAAADPAGPADDTVAEALAAAWADYLRASKRAGLAQLSPGRFLMPGDLEGAPVLTFAPLPPTDAPPDGLRARMAARFEAYKAHVVTPFLRTHFAALDRQVVLVDLLGAVAEGPRALADLGAGLSELLGAFRHGRPAFLERLLGGRRIDRLLFAATKADHLHPSQHARLAALMRALLSDAMARAAFDGARIQAQALAAIRATRAQSADSADGRLDLVRGIRLDTRREAAVFPGELPDDPARLLRAAADPASAGRVWPDAAFVRLPFAPPDWSPGEGPPHLGLDRALEFLLGDRLE
ncbi:MAG: YcjX family protein [Paracoccaceae bacterium]